MAGFITPPTTIVLDTGDAFTGLVPLASGAGIQFINDSGAIQGNATGATSLRAGSLGGSLASGETLTGFLPTGIIGPFQSLILWTFSPDRFVCFNDDNGTGEFRAFFRNSADGTIVVGAPTGTAWQIWYQASGPIP